MTGAIRELHEDYRAGRRSPVDVVQEHVEAAATLGRALNAFTALLDEAALAAAEASQGRYQQGTPLSIIDGVPISMKDLFHVKGTATGCGSHAYPPDIQPQDADMVRELKAAGAIIIGKNNLLEFAFGLVNPEIGPARNPWDPEKTIGGSSSGSAAAVGAGIGLASIGTDTAGSVRNPAALGGVVGFKPSYGHYSAEGLIPLSPSLDHIGLLTETVADAQAIFEALGGPLASRQKNRWRMVSVDLGYTSPDVQAAVKGLVDQVMDEGEARPAFDFDWSSANQAAIEMITAEAYAVHRELLRERWDFYGEPTRVRLLAGQAVRTHDYIRARQVRERLRRDWLAKTEDIDFILLPTLPAVAVSEAEALVEDLSTATLYTSTFALLGLPAISVPAGLGAHGLPAGLQIVGRPGRDADLLAFARRVEELRGPFPHPPQHVRNAP